MDYLIENNLLNPKYLPGVSKPRFLMAEVELLLTDTKQEGVPAFGPLEEKEWN